MKNAHRMSKKEPMKSTAAALLFPLFLLCGSLGASDLNESTNSAAPQPSSIPAASNTVPPSIAASGPKQPSPLRLPVEVAETHPAAPVSVGENMARTIRYGERDIGRIKTRLRYTTVIVLPRNEQIMDAVCGDKDYWVVNGSQNLVYLKPAKAGSSTDLNLVTASGNVYSFILSEVGDAEQPDLKVFVEPKDESMISALNGPAKFVPATELDNYKRQVDMAEKEARKAREDAQNAIDRDESKFRSQYPTRLKFAYRFDTNKQPFLVSQIYHDDKFTYIQAHPEETPALYEIKDGKPNLIQFDYQDGTYVVEKILDKGYLTIGKQKLNFERVE
jgi:type IV secretory pathway VirB9-like protein